MLADGLTDGELLLDGDCDDDGETDGLTLADGETLAVGETDSDALADGLTLADGEVLAVGDTDGDTLADGDRDDDGLTLGDNELLGDPDAVGDTDADGLTEAVGLTDAELASANSASNRIASSALSGFASGEKNRNLTLLKFPAPDTTVHAPPVGAILKPLRT